MAYHGNCSAQVVGVWNVVCNGFNFHIEHHYSTITQNTVNKGT